MNPFSAMTAIYQLLLRWRRSSHEAKVTLETISQSLARLEIEVKQIRNERLDIMAAIDSLSGAVTKLTAAVDRAVSEITTPHPTETAVQQAADTLNAQADRLDVAVGSAQGTTPPPAPAPIPTP